MLLYYQFDVHIDNEYNFLIYLAYFCYSFPIKKVAKIRLKDVIFQKLVLRENLTLNLT